MISFSQLDITVTEDVVRITSYDPEKIDNAGETC
jgi:hypothetical protein